MSGRWSWTLIGDNRLQVEQEVVQDAPGRHTYLSCRVCRLPCQAWQVHLQLLSRTYMLMLC